MKARKLILVSTVMTMLAASVAFADEPTAPTDSSGLPAAGVTAPVPDKAACHKLWKTVKQDRGKLKSDLKQFGRDSDQVKADRAQLKSDVASLKAARKSCHELKKSG